MTALGSQAAPDQPHFVARGPTFAFRQQWQPPLRAVDMTGEGCVVSYVE
jgi:hypothetical protein